MDQPFPEDMQARARRRVARKLGFVVHAVVFVAVNLGLFAINAAIGGPHWARFPLFGWGLGLAIHGLVTFLSLHGDGIRRTMLAREIERMRQMEH